MHLRTFCSIMRSRMPFELCAELTPKADITILVSELAQYMANNSLDPTYLIEVRDLDKLGVDLSFFPDREQIISPLGSEIGEVAEPDMEVVEEQGSVEIIREVAEGQATMKEVQQEQVDSKVAQELALEVGQEVVEAAEEVIVGPFD